MRTYSLDLKQKIIYARENQQLSIRQLAKIFGMASYNVQSQS